MINQYPLWKNILIVVVLIISGIYALPNLFPEDPALQISYNGDALPQGVQSRITGLLDQEGLAIKAVTRQSNKMLIRFADAGDQLEAKDFLNEALSDQYVVALNLAPATPGWLRVLNAKPMNLGLDLQGGVHFLLSVDMKAAIAKALDRYEGEFRTAMREAQIRYLGVDHDEDSLTVKFRDADNRDQALAKLGDLYHSELNLQGGDAADGYRLMATLTEDNAREIRKFALQQNITTLRKRVNELGVAEPSITQQGQQQVAVELPGVQDTARAKEILGATATLEFRLVDEQGDPYQAAKSGNVPINDELYHDQDDNPVLLKRRVMLTGDYITDAASGFDQRSGGPSVSITLDGKGARIFSDVSGDNVGRLMAVVFIENKTKTVEQNGKKVRKTQRNEEVINIARIREQLGKRFQITGLDTSRKARNLALLLRAGALAAPMEIVEERTVGPSLGQQNIDQGQKSVILGFILVILFMAIYYRLFGLVADVALMANLVLIIAIMSLIPGATLTLPGIAGIVLTVGMAVDANVLIFERIREELRNGNSPQSSIHSGYSKALSTIADANITTLIAAIVLFGFGTGPIKGFAVTLSIGIMASMFTAIMGTRAIINLVYGGRRSPVLSI